MKKSRIVLALAAVAACSPQKPATPPAPQPAPYELSVIPLPQSVEIDASQRFRPDTLTTIVVDGGLDSAATGVAAYLQTLLSPLIRTAPSRLLPGSAPSPNTIHLKLDSSTSGDEAYDLKVEPATFISGVPETAILGVEAPLWSETVINVEDYEYLAFPRVIAAAEVGWTRKRAWDGFARRLQIHDERLKALGINAGR